MFTGVAVQCYSNKLWLEVSSHIFLPDFDILDHFGHFFINGLVKYTLIEEMLFTGVAVLYYSNNSGTKRNIFYAENCNPHFYPLSPQHKQTTAIDNDWNTFLAFELESPECFRMTNHNCFGMDMTTDFILLSFRLKVGHVFYRGEKAS